MVDPDTVTWKGIRELFAPERFSFFFCEELAEAVRAMKSEKFDCAIVDIQAEGNRPVTSILQALDPAMPVILTTERNTPDLEIGAYRQQAFYYFVKPFGGEELKLVVQEALRKSNPEQALVR